MEMAAAAQASPVVGGHEGGEVRLEALEKRFDDVVAVDAIDLEIASGEFFSLLGPSGCGKTTTLRLIAGFVEPSEGEILVGERLLSSPARTLPPESRNMSMIFQSYALWPHMTVTENVAYGLKLRRLGRDVIARKVAAILDVTKLAALAGRYPGELSGGQQQMVAIGQALMSKPTYLLLDEPASGVAPILVDEIYDTIDRLVADGLGVVLVDQSVERALERSSRYYVMDNGSMVLSGDSTASAIDQINPILLGTLGSVPMPSTPQGSG